VEIVFSRNARDLSKCLKIVINDRFLLLLFLIKVSILIDKDVETVGLL